MQVQVNIQFDDLVNIVKKLPPAQLSKLKAEIENNNEKEKERADFEALLMNGPTFSKKQLETLAKTRKEINQWRTK